MPFPSSNPGETGDTPGVLHVVSTPIGNLGDMTFRAVEVLRHADGVLCEDTRHSRPLLAHFGVTAPMESLHEHNEAAVTPRIVERIRAGARLALISDAGTPLLSDPGFRLVRAVVDAGLPVVPIPGPSALLAALAAAGLPPVPFTFFGFLPRKGPERRAMLARLSTLEHTGVLYESPQRIGDTLKELEGEGCGERPAALARELTKHFEEVRRGTVSELIAGVEATPVRGEVVLLVGAGVPVPAGDEMVRWAAQVKEWHDGGLSRRDIMQRLVAGGVARNDAYRMAHDDRGSHGPDEG